MSELSRSRQGIIISLVVFFGICLAVQNMDAKKNQRKSKRGNKAAVTAPAPKQMTVGIEQLMGKFKWGMTSKTILKILEDNLREVNEPLIKKAASDPFKQDQLRREYFEKQKELKKSFFTFDGKKSPWDVSLVDKEFAHKNDETLVVWWTEKDRRFYFFYNDRLYKMFVAFNAELFEGKTFEDFAQVMEARFGPAERKYSPTISGESKVDHLAWPKSGSTVLRAKDFTGFYGNFCLVLIDADRLNAVMAGRKMNRTSNQRDPLIEAVLKGSENSQDVNEDIIDRVTGKQHRIPGSGSSSSSGSRS